MKIALSIVVIFFLIGCGEDKKEVQKVEPVATQKVVVEESISTVEDTKGKVIAVVVEDVIEDKAKIDAKVLYKACVGCHGVNGEKIALGKSKVIKDMSEKEIEVALTGYKNGTYGGAMKGIMKGQVKKISPAEIKSLSNYISNF